MVNNSSDNENEKKSEFNFADSSWTMLGQFYVGIYRNLSIL